MINILNLVVVYKTFPYGTKGPLLESLKPMKIRAGNCFNTLTYTLYYVVVSARHDLVTH